MPASRGRVLYRSGASQWNTRGVAISWSDAVADADNADDRARYDRAVAQARDLHPLVMSFIAAVQQAGKWPTYPEDWTGIPRDAVLMTSRDEKNRHVWTGQDRAAWAIKLTNFYEQVRVRVDGRVEIGYGLERTQTIAAADFDERMKAMEETKD